jgi:hypothetical protein
MTAYTDTSGTGQVVAMPFDGAVVEPKSAKLKPNEKLEIKVTATPQYKGQMNGSVMLKTKNGEGMLQVFGIVREADQLGVKKQ